MKVIEIKVGEVGSIIKTKQPAEHHDALRQLFVSKFAIDIGPSAPAALDKSKLEESSASSDLEMLPSSLQQQKMSSSDESLALSNEEPVTPPSDESENGLNRHRIIATGAKINEKEKYIIADYSISFMDGSLFKIESNKGNIWIVCVYPKFFAQGLTKEVYKVKWLLSCKQNGSIVYKEEPNRYVLNLFKEKNTEQVWTIEDQVRYEGRFIEEVVNTYAFYLSTKKLFCIREDSQYGFLMPDLGTSLADIIEDEEYTIEKRIKIALYLTQEVKDLFFKRGKVHCDLKPANSCFNGELVSPIDFDSIVAFDENIDKNIIIPFTKKYLNSFIWEPDRPINRISWLRKGPYRIIHSLGALVETCKDLIFRGTIINQEQFSGLVQGDFYADMDEYFLKQFCTEEFFLEQQEKIDSYFEELHKKELQGADYETLLDQSVIYANIIFNVLSSQLKSLFETIIQNFPKETVALALEAIKAVEEDLRSREAVFIFSAEELDSEINFLYSVCANLDKVKSALDCLKNILDPADALLAKKIEYIDYLNKSLDEKKNLLEDKISILISRRKKLECAGRRVGEILPSEGDRKPKRGFERFQFWSDPCLPTFKKVKAETALPQTGVRHHC